MKSSNILFRIIKAWCWLEILSHSFAKFRTYLNEHLFVEKSLLSKKLCFCTCFVCYGVVFIMGHRFNRVQWSCLQHVVPSSAPIKIRNVYALMLLNPVSKNVWLKEWSTITIPIHKKRKCAGFGKIRSVPCTDRITHAYMFSPPLIWL